MSLPKVAVVILNWNGKGFLEKFLPFVVEYSPEATVYLADNASSDGSVDFVKTTFPNVKIILNTKNEGFCRGYNLALSQIRSDYYILLNSDVEVTNGWLLPVINFMESHPEAGICQPKIKSYHQRDTFEYAGASGGFIDKYGYPFCRGRIFHHVEKDVGQYNNIIEITWASGACFFIKAEIYNYLAGLDEDFFAHMEEIDLCWRTISAGYKVYVVPESTVYHVGAGTLQKSSPFKTYLNFRNGLFLLHKNLPSGKLFPVIFSRLVLDGIAGIQFLLKGQWADTIAIIKAHGAYYTGFSRLQKKRKQQRQSWVCNSYSIVWASFVKGKKYFHQLP